MKHTASENATRYIGIILILISAVSFGAMPIFARVAYASGADPITVLFLCFGVAAVMMLGIMLASKTPFPRGPVLLELMVLGAIGYVGSRWHTSRRRRWPPQAWSRCCSISTPPW